MRIFFWKYAREKNYPGYHLTADNVGAKYLIERLTARLGDRLERPLRFTLSTPTERELEVPNNRRHISVLTAAELVISIDFEAVENILSVVRDSDRLLLTISEDMVLPLIEGISGLQRGEGDCSLRGAADGSECVWFWWRGSAD